MKDDKGLYYHPIPGNHSVRMYVRKVGDEICFRFWDAADEIMWKEHGWAPYAAIKQAIATYKSKSGFDPLTCYDINVAKALIEKDMDD